MKVQRTIFRGELGTERSAQMDEEAQKFMALEGLRSWANAVILQVERMQSSRAALLELRGFDSQWIKRMGQFRSDRHLFLVAAWKLIEHMDWADKLGCLENNNFSEIQEMRKDIKEMRDMNEHVLEYFLGDGRRQHAWVHKDDYGSTDASSTLGTKIGGRLDWVVLEAAVKRLLSNLPAPYFRPNVRLDRE